jgi:hypothetical protein
MLAPYTILMTPAPATSFSQILTVPGNRQLALNARIADSTAWNWQRATKGRSRLMIVCGKIKTILATGYHLV